MPWLLSYLNGSTAAGFAFARSYRHLPGRGGAIKGFIAGLLGWFAVNLIFFPLLGLGLFAAQVGRGWWPTLFSLAMMLTYSVVMGIVYSRIDVRGDRSTERMKSAMSSTLLTRPEADSASAILAD